MSGVIGILVLASVCLRSWKNGVNGPANLGIYFGNSSEIQCTAEVPFWILESWLSEKFGVFFFLWGYSLGCYCSPREMYFFYRKTTFGHAEFKTRFSKALEEYS